MNRKLKFRRLFSQTMYKDLKLPLAKMTFSKDFVSTTRGDEYPVIVKDSTCTETVKDNLYRVDGGITKRFFTAFFPFATFEVSFEGLLGTCGFAFTLPDKQAELTFCNGCVTLNGAQAVPVPYEHTEKTMLISCRPGAFDVFFVNNGKPEFLHTYTCEDFMLSNSHSAFKNGYVSLIAGNVTVKSVCAYMDCGISQADIRFIKYENGEVLTENGRVFFTATVRMQASSFQGIFSWVPTTNDIALTGTLFFDCGDGFWRNYLASSLLFNRKTKQWYIWTSSFEHKHLLCYGAFNGDVRFGVNVVDVTVMAPSSDEAFTDFLGIKGDEDPDFYFNEKDEKWYMAICRIDRALGAYRYAFFTSDDPFKDYRYIGKGLDGAETGGSFVMLEGEPAFICGNDFNKRANYRIYTSDGMREAEFDFDDGGFRGWGAVLPLPSGNRTRYFLLTFDRHNGSDYGWSYGNIYCFEGFFE